MSFLLETLESLGTGTYTVTRRDPPTVTRGVAAAGTSATFPIDAGVQPVTRGKNSTPEAARGVDSYSVYTATRLRTDEAGGVADMIELADGAYDVVEVVHWSGLGEEFWIATVSKRSQR